MVSAQGNPRTVGDDLRQGRRGRRLTDHFVGDLCPGQGGVGEPQWSESATDPRGAGKTPRVTRVIDQQRHLIVEVNPDQIKAHIDGVDLDGGGTVRQRRQACQGQGVGKRVDGGCGVRGEIAGAVLGEWHDRLSLWVASCVGGVV